MASYSEELRRRLRLLGEAVRKERGARGISQEELAYSSGLHRTYVGAVERGERNISVGSLCTLADSLGVSPKELMPD